MRKGFTFQLLNTVTKVMSGYVWSPFLQRQIHGQHSRCLAALPLKVAEGLVPGVGRVQIFTKAPRLLETTVQDIYMCVCCMHRSCLIKSSAWLQAAPPEDFSIIG
ncbi:unnamed protein product [Ixodes pacificus]